MSLEARERADQERSAGVNAQELSARVWQEQEKQSQSEKPEQGKSGDSSDKVLSQLELSENAKVKDKVAETLPEANQFLFKAAEQSVNQSIYRLPLWSRLPKPRADLGCVSSFSDRYRSALQMAGLIDSAADKRYRNFYQVNMDELNKSMGVFKTKEEERLLRPISEAELKEGDVIQGLNPGTFKRHMGIVGKIENGQRMVYDNSGGIWQKGPLEERFQEYRVHNFYRAHLPRAK